MNIKLLLIASASVLFISGCSSTGGNYNSEPRQVRATVAATIVSSEEAPLVCASQRNTNPLIAGIIGGVIGNQIGGGSGRKVATVVGAGAGVAVANSRNRGNQHNQNCRRDGWNNQIQYINPYNGRLEYSVIKTDRGQRQGQQIRTTILINPQ